LRSIKGFANVRGGWGEKKEDRQGRGVGWGGGVGGEGGRV
jgi:hypothetical protein